MKTTTNEDTHFHLFRIFTKMYPLHDNASSVSCFQFSCMILSESGSAYGAF